MAKQYTHERRCIEQLIHSLHSPGPPLVLFFAYLPASLERACLSHQKIPIATLLPLALLEQENHTVSLRFAEEVVSNRLARHLHRPIIDPSHTIDPATMPTTTTTTEPSRIAQHSPLLNLPPEIRLLIYRFVLQHTVDELLATSSLRISISPSQPSRPAIQSALALLHTSSLLRSESSAALRSLANLERFKVRRSLGWVDSADVVNAEIGGKEWGETVGRGDVMRDVRGFVERVCGSVHGAEEEQ